MNTFFSRRAAPQRLWHVPLLVGALFAVLALCLASPAQAAGYTLAPVDASVRVGQVMVFEGTGFVPGERVATWATSPDGGAVSGDYETTDHDTGALRVGFAVPKNGLNGRWSFTAFGETSKTPVITTFEVVGGSDTQEFQAGAQPTSGPPGTVFAFAATGYDEKEQVSYWMTAPNGSVFAAYPKGDRADENGRVDFTWTAPADAPRGTWVMTIQGLGKRQVARAVRFEVT